MEPPLRRVPQARPGLALRVCPLAERRGPRVSRRSQMENGVPAATSRSSLQDKGTALLTKPYSCWTGFQRNPRGCLRPSRSWLMAARLRPWLT